MDLTLSIKSAENQFKQILEVFFVSVYNENDLPSHGLEHHRRVWKTAKDLTTRLAEKNLIKDPRLISSLIISSYLHDIGMVKDHGPRHGRHSHELCKLFLHKHNLNENDFPGLLDAILGHDNKDYSVPGAISLQTLLSVSDDLDAFGFNGIYRYIEIYVIRGVSQNDLAAKVRDNALRRYNHFQELFRTEKVLITKHSRQFRILDDFFINYDSQLNTGNTGGYVKVVDILSGMVKNKTSMHSIIQEHEKSPDKVISWFFTNLKADLY